VLLQQKQLRNGMTMAEAVDVCILSTWPGDVCLSLGIMGVEVLLPGTSGWHGGACKVVHNDLHAGILCLLCLPASSMPLAPLLHLVPRIQPTANLPVPAKRTPQSQPPLLLLLHAQPRLYLGPLLQR
jgi:hypothetical protein